MNGIRTRDTLSFVKLGFDKGYKPKQLFPVYETKLNLVVRLQF